MPKIVPNFAVTELGVPFQTTLCYILFSYHLKLGHNDEAYDAMVANPDKSRRKDSLRQFIVTLFDRRQLKQVAILRNTKKSSDFTKFLVGRQFFPRIRSKIIPKKYQTFMDHVCRKVFSSYMVQIVQK
jgi:hypothetical protein